jgi:hypothetical protein
MSDDYIRVFNVIGLASNLIGVLILFRWGMPFRVATRGITLLAADGPRNVRDLALDHIYTVCGWTGLVLLILGTVLQIIAALMPPTNLSQ